ncbi:MULTISPECIES: hypothetical protein [Frankia]|uniref:hypothetical protein n=1 Tax=Frankia TaxID=1854 RepID=UPI001F5B569B|nr:MULTISPECIES: hypothetical protein [Frankia]
MPAGRMREDQILELDRLAVLVGQDAVVPSGADLFPLIVLGQLVREQRAERRSVEVNFPPSAAGFRRPDAVLGVVLHDLLRDRQHGTFFVEARPGRPARFTAAKAVQPDQFVHGCEPVGGRLVEERADLVGFPRFDFLPARFGEFHSDGRVELDHALVEGVTERRLQQLVHVADSCRADGPPPLRGVHHGPFQRGVDVLGSQGDEGHLTERRH